MIVGAYVLDLYCDAENNEHGYRDFPFQYTENNERNCRRMARRDGWWLTSDREAYCPKCAKRMRQIKARKQKDPD